MAMLTWLDISQTASDDDWVTLEVCASVTRADQHRVDAAVCELLGYLYARCGRPSEDPDVPPGPQSWLIDVQAYAESAAKAPLAVALDWRDDATVSLQWGTAGAADATTEDTRRTLFVSLGLSPALALACDEAFELGL